MAVSSIVLISALAVAATLGVAPKAAPTQPVEQVRPASASKNPYAKLFTPLQENTPRELFGGAQPSNGATATSRVVCGMVVIQVTPSVDPKMVVRSGQIDPKPDYKIRSIQPRICNE
jgi:hypothetical protein